jgi:hypothetical protein
MNTPSSELELIKITSLIIKEPLTIEKGDCSDLRQRLARFFRDEAPACDASFPISYAVDLDNLLRNFSERLSKCGYPNIGWNILISWNVFLKTRPDLCETIFNADNIERSE